MKKYIAPDIECVEVEPLQILAGSTPNTDETDRNEDFAPEGSEGEAKQHTGAFDADWD